MSMFPEYCYHFHECQKESLLAARQIYSLLNDGHSLHKRSSINCQSRILFCINYWDFIFQGFLIYMDNNTSSFMCSLSLIFSKKYLFSRKERQVASPGEPAGSIKKPHAFASHPHGSFAFIRVCCNNTGILEICQQ